MICITQEAGMEIGRRSIKAISIFLLLAFNFSVCFASTYSGGDGSASDPFQIATPEDLDSMKLYPEDLDKNFILTSDIDMSDYTYTTALIAPDIENSGFPFDGKPFSGVFDGNDYNITNLTIVDIGDSDYYLGLFGVNDGGTIKNLGIEDFSITGLDNSRAIGGLCGSNSEGTIDKCVASGSVNGGDGSNFLGGLCGSNSSTITNCHSTSNVVGGDNSDDLGGLCGQNTGTIDNCYAEANVSGDDYLGGLCGTNHYDATVENCTTIGLVTGGDGSNFLGGLCGRNLKRGIIENCTASVSVYGQNSQDIGGLCGWNWEGKIINCEASGNIIGIYVSDTLGGLCGNNNGTIEKCHSTGSVIGGDGSGFLGGLCGNNYEGIIENCYSEGTITGGDNSKNIGGLCGKNHNDARIENCFATGFVTVGNGSESVGGLCGRNSHSTIKNCYSTSPVVGGDYLTFLGGLCGLNHLGGAIENCYASGFISSRDNSQYLGGLCGNNNGTIEKCRSTGSVNSGYYSDNLGGLCGSNGGGLSLISNCYAKGSVTAGDFSERIGGLCGYNVFGTIENCYATGLVSGYKLLGGLSGKNIAGIINRCFWDIETSNMDSSDGGTGLTTVEMMKEITFTDAGWDFVFESFNGSEDIWMIHEHHDYPKFTYQNISPNSVPGPDQTAYAWVDGYAKVVLDANDSYDPDGDELTYQWSWSVDGNDYEVNDVNFTAFLPVGLHTFELVVNDGIDDSEPNYCDVNVIEPLSLENALKITPSKIVSHTRGPKEIKVNFTLPDWIWQDDIIDQPFLLCPSEYCIESVSTKTHKHKGAYQILFSKDDLMNIITSTGTVEVNIVGQLKSGQFFYATDYINIK
jgi:hypothetical protein